MRQSIRIVRVSNAINHLCGNASLGALEVDAEAVLGLSAPVVELGLGRGDGQGKAEDGAEELHLAWSDLDNRLMTKQV